MPAPMAHISGLLNGVLVPGAAGMRSVAGPPLRSRAGPRAGGARADLVPRRSAHLLHRHGTRARGGSAVRRVVGPARSPAAVRRSRRPSSRRRRAPFRLPGQADVRIHRGADRDHQHRRRPLREGPRHRRACRGCGRAAGVRPGDGRGGCHGGTAGELWVRGPEMFAGYADGVQTAAVIARGGWFRTGDLATVDDEGWVRIVGRLKDVIIRGGENISASEVEAALEAHPAVHHAVAVGYPDPLMGERVAAFVESAAPFDLEECRRWFASRGMAVFKTPEKVERLDQLPLLGSGKADRAELRRRAAATWHAVAVRATGPAPEPSARAALALTRASPQPHSARAAGRPRAADRSLRRAGRLVGTQRRDAHRAERVGPDVRLSHRVDVLRHGPGRHGLGRCEHGDDHPGPPDRLRAARPHGRVPGRHQASTLWPCSTRPQSRAP